MDTRAAIYARVSTEEQTSNYSLSGQITDCRKYAAEKGYTVIAEFEEAFTGAALFRPELDKLRTLIGRIDVVIVYELDRLSRSAAHLTIIEDEFKRGNVAIEYVVGYANTPEGQLLKTIQSGIKEYEREVIKGRFALGKKRRAKSGKVNLGICAPYGYTKNKETGQLEIHEEESEIVRLIFKWYTIGDDTGKKLGASAIATRLTDMGVPTKFGKQGHPKKNAKAVWASQTIIRILTNETYLGIWYANRHHCVRTPEGRHITYKPREEWIPVEVPAIVEHDVFELVEKQKKQNFAQSPRNTKYDYLLRQRMVCAKCGKPFYCETRYNYSGQPQGVPLYICGGERRRSNDGLEKICSRALHQPSVDDLVWQYMVEAFKTPDILLKSVSIHLEQHEKEGDALRGYLTTIETKLETLAKQEARLLELYVDAEIEKTLLKQKLQELKDERARYEQEKSTLQERIVASAPIVTLEEFHALCEAMSLGLENLSFEEKRTVVDLFDIRIVVQRGESAQDDTFIITGNLPFDTQTVSSLPCHGVGMRANWRNMRWQTA